MRQLSESSNTNCSADDKFQVKVTIIIRMASMKPYMDQKWSKLSKQILTIDFLILVCCVPANNLSGTHPSPRLSVGLNCSISHKTSCPSSSPYTLQHCVHCWKLIQSSILYFLVVHAFLLVRQHTVQQYNFLLRVSGSEFAQAFINSRQSKLFASLLYIQSWLFLTKIC